MDELGCKPVTLTCNANDAELDLWKSSAHMKTKVDIKTEPLDDQAIGMETESSGILVDMKTLKEEEESDDSYSNTLHSIATEQVPKIEPLDEQLIEPKSEPSEMKVDIKLLIEEEEVGDGYLDPSQTAVPSVIMNIKEEDVDGEYDEELMGPVEDDADGEGDDEGCSMPQRKTEDGEESLAKTRALSSSHNSEATPERAPHLFPNQCLICKREKTRIQSWNRLRVKEKLTLCDTPTAGRLLAAAEERRHESLLAQIQGKDLRACEAQYHFTCYRDYTRFVYKNNNKTQRNNMHEIAYKHFCETVIEEKIFKKREAFRLSQLTMLFKDVVKEKEGVDISTYTSQTLKARLQKSHPSLRFRKASQVHSSVDNRAAKQSRGENLSSTSPSSSCQSNSTQTDYNDATGL